jgi:sugar lactone lactonase YvrE
LCCATLAAMLCAASLQAQPQIATVISTGLNEPNSITSDANNNIYFTDAVNNRIVKFVPATNGVFTLAGSGSLQTGLSNSVYGGQALFSQPLGIVYDSFRGGLVVVDQGNQVLRLVTLGGAVSTLAGVPSTLANPDGGFTDGAAATAQFSYPVGIATDSAGNLYIADQGNSAIRRVNSTNGVTTVQVTNYTFHGPAAVALDSSNNLWVADTWSNSICVISNISVITNQSVFVIAGASHHHGTNDSANAASASFNLPSGLLWDPNGAGLIISDTGNETIRRLYPNTTQGGFSVQTVAGVPGVAGNVNGLTSIAEFSSPIGLAVDVIDNGYYIVDRGNNALRRDQSGPPQPPVANPQIGLITFPYSPSSGLPSSLFTALPFGGLFHTNNIIGILNSDSDPNVQTFYVISNTPANSFIPTPVPTTNSLFAPNYPGNGSPPASPLTNTIVSPQPNEVTLYAISLARGRAPSQIVSANFSYVTGTPSISGNNGAVVLLSDITDSASMFYTLDGSTPSNAAPSIGPLTSPTNLSFAVTNPVTLSVQAFAAGFAPSAVVSNVFYPSNFIANQITFGFASGEASSEFVGSAGRRFYVPVTLNLLPGATMYSLQFDVTVTNQSGAPAVGTTYMFDSMLMQPVPGTPGAYFQIPPAAATNATGHLENLLFTNASLNLLGVGWLEIPPETNLYPANAQDLIAFSLAHENLFPNAGSPNSVIVGGYSFVIPPGAPYAPTTPAYTVQIIRPSADGDGFAQNVLMQTPTHGSRGVGAINSIKDIKVGAIPYLVGDVAPFRWFNAGDFGDSNILNNDVLETFRSAVYGFNTPPAGTDFYDAMDSSDAALLTSADYFTLTEAQINTAINAMTNGDGHLDITDVYVTFRRSLDPSLLWVQRCWSNGSEHFQYVSNVYNPSGSAAPAERIHQQSTGAAHFIAVGGDTVQAGGSQSVQVPVRVLAADSLPIRVLAMNVDVIPLDGSPAVTSGVTFSPAAGLGSPYAAMSQGANNYAAAWLNSSNSGVSGTNVIGTVTVTLPANVTGNSSYLVHIEHFSASPNGLALFHSTVTDGLITVGNRTGSSWGDGIPDTWRLIYFGTISNLLSAANLDPDGDGASNWQEYVAGTNPMDPTSVLQLTPMAPAPNFTVEWPSVPGKTYQVKSATSLFSTNWITTASNLAGTGQMMQLSDTNTPAPPARFYRVQVQ